MIRSVFLFGALISKAFSYCCQELPLPAGDDRLDEHFHFALDYRPDVATPLDGSDLPTPEGFSGSLVWNTRFVEFAARQRPWSADDAQVTGLVWGWWSSSGCLVARRAEHVRSFLLRVAAL